jgi:hypothetical protein
MKQSLWVVNNMFGTGGRGLAIITVVIPVITYAVVFNLLHTSTKKEIEEGIKKAIFTWPRILWLKLKYGIKMAVTWFRHLWGKLWNGKQETVQV